MPLVINNIDKDHMKIKVKKNRIILAGEIDIPNPEKILRPFFNERHKKTL